MCLVLGDVRYASTKHKDLQGPVSWGYVSWEAELTLLWTDMFSQWRFTNTTVHQMNYFNFISNQTHRAQSIYLFWWYDMSHLQIWIDAPKEGRWEKRGVCPCSISYLVQSVEHVTLNLRRMSLGPMLGTICRCKFLSHLIT